MQSRIAVPLVALVVPIVLAHGCGDTVEPTGDRAYDWTVTEAGVDRNGLAQVTILLEHPDSSVLAGRDPSTEDAGFRVHGMIYRRDGMRVDVRGIRDVWDNFEASGGGYVVNGYIDGQTARLSIRNEQMSWIGDAGAVQHHDPLGNLTMCLCTTSGRRASCVRCGTLTACCFPDPGDPIQDIGPPVPGQVF